MIDYHMNVHVFGNSPSLAVSTNGLRKAVEKAESDVEDFIYKNFYVDTAWFLVELLKKPSSY